MTQSSHISPFRLEAPPSPTQPLTFLLEDAHPPLSNPHRPNASAFVIAALSALCLHGEPACGVGVSLNAGDSMH